MSITIILSLLIFIPIGYIMYIFTGYMIQNINEINNRKTIKQIKVPENQMLITERIGCLGRYMDKEIPSQVRLETGELFEYENILKLNQEGFYIVKDPEIMRIRVDNNLIFKLVSITSL